MNRKSWAWACWVCLAAGCTGVEEPADHASPKENEALAVRLLGEWEFRKTDFEDSQRYVFGSDGRFRSISVWGTDTSINEGSYYVVDSMAMSKGISLRGESKSLVGEWKTTATVPDSAGGYRTYTYIFTADGYLLIPYPDFIDTSRYVVDGSLIKSLDPHTGRAKMTLAHEIIEDRLSLYNLDTERRLRLVR